MTKAKTKKANELDAELKRILDTAAEMAPISNELPFQLQQNQSTWPWQVRQVPAYTSDHTPTNRQP